MEENQMVVANPTASLAADDTDTKLQTGTLGLGVDLNIELFGMFFSGIFEKGSGGIRLLVAPGGKTLRQSATLKSVLDACGVSTAQQASVTDALTYVGMSVEGLIINLDTAFVYHSSYPADACGTDTTEYAFSIDFQNSAQPKDPPPFKIDNIGFSIWNTTRASIKNSMSLVTVADKLKELSTMSA
ncbi:MAG: hypothetical protein LBL98_04625 [Ruminococcus sp.]|jgi:hypothetical protein|nr:hypothetical protein [Ruminococcus sp.]